MNYLFVLEYNGSNYSGWQSQNSGKNYNKLSTIENELLKAINIITKFNSKLFVSGRTDAGVHALNQVANYKMPFYFDTSGLKISLNGLLPRDISIKNIEIVHDSFHATFDTVSKVYMYRVNSGFRSALLSGYSWFVKEKLNLGLMNEVSRIFVGRNNFINFTKKDKERYLTNYYRVVKAINICQTDYGFDILVEGEGFLRHMVRRIVGAIVACGSGRMDTGCVSQLLNEESMAPNKSLISINQGAACTNVLNAPPSGLFLHSVRYEHKNYC